jgi:hypothetical protein
MYCTANIKHRAFAQEDNPRIVAELRRVFLNQVRPEEGILHSREYNQTPRIANKAVYADHAPTGTLVFFFRLDNDTTQLHVELKERETKYFYELRRVISKAVEAFNRLQPWYSRVRLEEPRIFHEQFTPERSAQELFLNIRLKTWMEILKSLLVKEKLVILALTYVLAVAVAYGIEIRAKPTASFRDVLIQPSIYSPVALILYALAVTGWAFVTRKVEVEFDVPAD